MRLHLELDDFTVTEQTRRVPHDGIVTHDRAQISRTGWSPAAARSQSGLGSRLALGGPQVHHITSRDGVLLTFTVDHAQFAMGA